MDAARREFLRNVGFGSIVLGSLPTLINTLATPTWAQGRMNFHFVTVSAAGPAGTAAQPQHLLANFGQGHFDASGGRSRVVGRGGFFHFTSPGTPPLPLVGSGTWEARSLVSYKQIGKYGVAAAGIAEIVVDISQEMPSRAVIKGASLRVVCNLRPAGLINPGEIEGVTLSIPGTEFVTSGTPGPFRPIASPDPAGSVGLTVFTTVPTI
jgi:hypothetical protein